MASLKPLGVGGSNSDARTNCTVSETEFDDLTDPLRSTALSVLPSPEIVSCETVSLCADDQFLPQMGALHLDWNGWPGARRPHAWRMPLGLTVTGPVPTRFGVRISRIGEDQYTLHLVWDRSGFAWADLTRNELKATSLAELLASIGTSLDSLLGQPVRNDLTVRH
jgi:hypothetical protein